MEDRSGKRQIELAGGELLVAREITRRASQQQFPRAAEIQAVVGIGIDTVGPLDSLCCAATGR